MNKTYTLVLLAFALIFAACNSSTKKQNSNEGKEVKGRIAISGAFALYPITVRWAEEFKKEYPNVVIDVSAGGAGKGMTDALSQMVDLGMVSREVSPEEVAKGAWSIAVTKDAVLPTINSANPYLPILRKSGVSKDQFKKIFVTGEIKYWEELFGEKGKQKINIYGRSDACGAAATWAAYFDAKQEDLLGLGVFGDPGVADAVKNDVYALGFNNVVYIYDIISRKKYEKMEVLPIDLNDNRTLEPNEIFYSELDSIVQAISQGVYPSPPARDLYFVSKGIPQNRAVLTFIDWILTNGQKYVLEAGYVKLSDESIEIGLVKLSK